MKKKYLIAPAFAALVFAGAATASAHGMFGFGGSNLTPDQIAQNQTTMFQNEANLLGVSVDDVKNAWAQGKTLQDLATEKGITQDQLQQKLKDQRNAQMKTQLQNLVDKGVITQAQADQRLAAMENMQANGKGFGRGHHGMGLGL